ncbi:MAG: hypothetical protein FWD67_07235 [Betaproteobacteria bacterium]|nr:hypothetical protein [Betaproteobacteria bacterium]
MFLANAVKLVKFAAAMLVGATILFNVAYWIIWLFAVWYEPRYIRSDSDIDAVFLPTLVILILSILVGAYLGYRWARKQG